MTITLKDEVIDITKFWLDAWKSGSPLVAITPTALPNVPFDAKDLVEWASLEILSGDILRITFGSPSDNTNRHTGVIRIRIKVKNDTGIARLYELASLAVEKLSFKTFDNVTTRESMPRLTGTVGQYQEMIIDVNYITDYNF